jgi:hypothetical protein
VIRLFNTIHSKYGNEEYENGIMTVIFVGNGLKINVSSTQKKTPVLYSFGHNLKTGT